jgi:hypothetical protein
MDIANAHTVAETDALPPTTAISGNATWREQDYAWTHNAPVEWFFVALTIVIVPVAILRLLRRLRWTSFAMTDRRHLDGNS